MRVAILGAGFAGLATACYLLKHTQGSASIDLFDPLPIGSGASGLSSGLLHAFAGKHANRARYADHGINATHELITEASKGIHGSIVLSKGILRPATTEEQLKNFQEQASSHAEVEWWDEKKCLEKVEGLHVLGGGLYIKNGLTIDVASYLKGLWQSCALLGAQFHQKVLKTENEIAKYDKVIFALGFALKMFKAFEFVPIQPIKGQSLEIEWPLAMPTLPFSLVSQGYLVMGKEHDRCLAGATFEREFNTPHAEPEIATPLILEKIAPFFPPVKNAKILACRAGIRASTPSHLPLVGNVSQKYWYVTGLGSKGLLYHAWIGDLLAQTILSNDPALFPKELWLSPK